MGMNGKHSMLILDITVSWVFVGMCLSLHSRDIRNIYFFAHCYMKVCRRGCWIRTRLISCIDGVPKMNQNIADLGYPYSFLIIYITLYDILIYVKLKDIIFFILKLSSIWLSLSIKLKNKLYGFFSCEQAHGLKIDRIWGDFDKKKIDICMPQKITCLDTLFQDFLHHAILWD